MNCRDLDGRHSTPLHFAAGYNRVNIVQYLLENGADAHAKDKGYGSTNLKSALCITHPAQASLRDLVLRGGRPDVSCEGG